MNQSALCTLCHELVRPSMILGGSVINLDGSLNAGASEYSQLTHAVMGHMLTAHPAVFQGLTQMSMHYLEVCAMKCTSSTDPEVLAEKDAAARQAYWTLIGRFEFPATVQPAPQK